MSNKYKSVQLPTSLTNLVDEVVAKHSFGYRTRAEFINEATRLHLEERLKELREQEPKKEEEVLPCQ